MIVLLVFVSLLCVIFFVFLTSKDRMVLLGNYQSFEFNNSQRRYLVLSPKKPVTKIVVGLHGFGDTPRRFAYYTGLHNALDSETLVLYPFASDPTKQGTKRGWNSGFCCGSGWLNNVDDSGFIMALIDTMKQEYNAPDAKVYITGFSNGAFMTQRLATDYPDLIDGVAAVSGSIGTNKTKLEPRKPIPILLMHGKQDTIVPFNGGVGSSDPDFTWLSHEDTLKTWLDINKGIEKTNEVTYVEDGHKWHGWRIANIWHKVPEASKEVAAFFNSLD